MAIKEKIQLPEFQGIPLIKIPEYIPKVDFLRGDFGKAVLEEYKARADEDYHDNKNLRFLTYDTEQDVVTGSNSFTTTLINNIIAEQGHTATQADLERIIALNRQDLNLRGHYEDTGLVLRSNEEPNSYLANDLMKQLRNTELPVMIPLKNLDLRNDDNSPYGLAFNIIGETIYAPILNHDSGYFSSEDIDEETGLPKKLEQGNRYLFTGKKGLSRLYIYRNLNSTSDGDDLADSDVNDRVVIVSGEAAQKNLEGYISQLRVETERQKAEIEQRFAESLKYLQTGKK